MANPAPVRARMMIFIAGMGGGGRAQRGAPCGYDTGYDAGTGPAELA